FTPSGLSRTSLLPLHDALPILFIDGARPDVEAAYPLAPRRSRAGWGVMVLTNFLPGQGNGAYQFFMYARDAEGAATLLGTRTIRSEEHTSELQSRVDLVCRLLL